METLQLDAKIKSLLDNFDWNKIESPPTNHLVSCHGLLNQIGCDYASLLIEIFTPESKKTDVQPPPPKQSQPRYSSLNLKQHQQYLTYLEKFKNVDFNTISADGKHAFKDYKFLHRKVLEEQHQFHEYAFQVALSLISNYDVVTVEAENYLKHYLAVEKKRIQQYMQCYIFHQTLVISVVPYVSDPQPKFENLSVSMGKPLLMSIPDSDIVIPAYDSHRRNTVHLKTITEDENAKKLAKCWNADIVTSLSALRTLADNSPPFDKEWEMPMIIEHLEDSSGASRKAIFIDKALPPKSFNGREKMSRYFKKAVKQFLFNLSTQSTSSDEEDDSSESEEDSDMDNDDDDNDDVDDDDSDGDDDDLHVNESNALISHECSSKVVRSSSSHGAARKRSDDEENQQTASDELSIPQLDGTDDKASSKKASNFTKRKTRLSSVPSSVAHAANLSVWTSSFKALPKSGIRSNSRISQASLFSGWSSAKKEDKKKADEVDVPCQPVDSEEDNLVIDSGGEDAKQAKQELASSRDAEKLENDEEDSKEQLEITFKATEIPSNVLESMMGSDADPESSPSDSAEVIPTRRSTRSRSRMESVSDQSESKYNTRSNRINAKNLDKNKKTSDVTPRSEPELSDASTDKAPKSSRKRKASKTDEAKKSKSKKESSAVVETEVKSLRKINLRSKSENDADVEKIKKSVNNPTKKTASKTSNSTLTNLNSASPSDRNRTMKDNSANALLSESIQNSQSKTPTTQPRKRLVIGSAKVNSKTQAKRSNVSRATSDSTSKKSNLSTESHNETDAESADVLGQILNMQKGRKDKVSYQDSSDLKKLNALSFAVVPSVPSPMETDAMSFDHMLQLHKTKLVEPEKEVFYSLWSLGTYRILIRGCLHGKLRNKCNPEKHPKNVSIRTMLEYQPDLGVEKLTKSEACAEWLDLQFRPQPSVVLRCRVDPFSSKCLRFEQVCNSQATYNSYEAAGFSHLSATKLLYSVFQKLISNSSYCDGCFLITHKVSANEVVVRRSSSAPSSKMVIYDLQREYANPGRPILCTPQTIPYHSLDPRKQTAWQMANRRIPMTFDLKPKGESSHEGGKKNKKGKKKKKKMTEDNE